MSSTDPCLCSCVLKCAEKRQLHIMCFTDQLSLIGGRVCGNECGWKI
uniref:Uncharacterized protein n=1 Tax=Anguilla anguilla TaxID=7936 RepID=A0A0E9VXQ5_ANGAN